MAKKKNAETKPVAVQTNEVVTNCDQLLTDFTAVKLCRFNRHKYNRQQLCQSDCHKFQLYCSQRVGVTISSS